MRTFMTFLLGLAALCGAWPIAAQEAAGTIKSLRGQTTLERAGVRRPAKVGEALQEKDRLRTGEDGQASVALRDQSLLAIGPRADVDLSRFRFAPTTHQGEQQVRVRSGSLAAISGKIAKASPEAVQFNAGTVTLGVRGTQFVMEVQPQGDGVLHWRDGSGQPLRNAQGLCWQQGTSGLALHSDCHPDRFVLLPDRDGQVGRITLTHPSGSLTLSTAHAAAQAGPQTLAPLRLSEAEVRSRYQSLIDSLPPAPKTFVLRFASGSAQALSAESLPVLEQIRAAVAGWPVAADLSVVGHTDTVGDASSNDALSLERARTVVKLLRDAGVQPAQWHPAGRGQRELQVPTPANTPEALNRRVEVTLY